MFNLKEPKGQTKFNLKEIYEYKLKLLEQKNRAQAMIYQNRSVGSANTITANNENDKIEREANCANDIIKVTVEDIIKPKSAQTAN